VVTAGTQSVQGEAVPFPERATLLGPCRVAPRELPGVTAKLIDLDPADVGTEECAELILGELDARTHDDLVAFRQGRRWTQKLTRISADRPESLPRRLKLHGTYLITGGLGGIASTLAEYLARQVKARLVLVSRRAMPARDAWAATREVA
jgi:hypothetical protein